MQRLPTALHSVFRICRLAAAQGHAPASACRFGGVLSRDSPCVSPRYLASVAAPKKPGRTTAKGDADPGTEQIMAGFHRLISESDAHFVVYQGCTRCHLP